jgi:hypothetical protein
MKHPPVQLADAEALRRLQAFIAEDAAAPASAHLAAGE